MTGSVQGLWEGAAEKETVLMVLQAECEVQPGRPEDYFPRTMKRLTRSSTQIQETYPYHAWVSPLVSGIFTHHKAEPQSAALVLGRIGARLPDGEAG
jgi:hypothetical protein